MIEVVIKNAMILYYDINQIVRVMKREERDYLQDLHVVLCAPTRHQGEHQRNLFSAVTSANECMDRHKIVERLTYDLK